MAEVKVLVSAKILRDGTAVRDKKYAIAFDAAEDATVAALVQRLRSKEAFAGLRLEVEGVTVLDRDFNAYVEVERGDRLTDRGEYVVTFIESSNRRFERAVASTPRAVQVKERPPSASDDDIIWEPAPKVAAQSSGPERKPKESKRSGLSAESTRRSCLSCSATSSPTRITSVAKASSKGDSNSDKAAASSTARRPDSQSSHDAGKDVIETAPDARRCEPPQIKQEDNNASDALAVRASGVPVSVVSSRRTDRSLFVEAAAPSTMNGNTAGGLSTVTAPARQTQFSAATAITVASVTVKTSPNGGNAADVQREAAERQKTRTHLVDAKADHKQGEEAAHRQPVSIGARSQLQNTSHAKNIRHDPVIETSTPSTKHGKLRLSRPTAAARGSNAPAPMEMIHEDAFPPPDQRNACHQMTIDQLRRNGQLVEHSYVDPLAELGQVSAQMDCEAMEPIMVESPKDEPTEADSVNAARTNYGVKCPTIARQVSHSSAELPTKPRRSRAVKIIEVEPAGSGPRESDVDRANDESPGRRMIGKRNPSRDMKDTRSQDTTKISGQKPNEDGTTTKTRGSRSGTVKRHKCDECGEERRQLSLLLMHKRIHTSEKPFACDECSNRYPRRGELVLHKRFHTGEKPFECDECPQRFARKHYLTNHKRTHTGEKPFTCGECGKRFAQHGSLSVHKRTHTGAKPYVCEVCGKGFARSHHLADHMRKHTGEKPFKCDECHRCFAASSSLKSHKRRHRGA